MNSRLMGKPGVEKTTKAYPVAKRIGHEVYILQATVDTCPEVLLVNPALESEGKLRYTESPRETAN